MFYIKRIKHTRAFIQREKSGTRYFVVHATKSFLYSSMCVCVCVCLCVCVCGPFSAGSHAVILMPINTVMSYVWSRW